MIYVMGDIHGNMNGYIAIMKKIDLQPDDHLYVLGDVIDREPFGARILLDLLNRDNATVLLGNHELMMRNALAGKERNALGLWLRNGGLVTQNEMNDLPRKDGTKVISALFDLPIKVEITVGGTNYLLVHSAPPELSSTIPSKYKDDESFSVWTRLATDTPMPEGKTVILGHTPTEYYQKGEPLRIWYGKDKIGIDCGSGHDYPACRIACIRLDDMVEYYSR